MKKASDFLKGCWYSVFRTGWPQSAKEQSLVMTSSLFLHLHPVKVKKRTLAFRLTLGLGMISFFLFVCLVVTGILLMLYYTPYPAAAYRSMKDLEFAVSFGWILRNMHRWAAHGMVLIVILHLCRVFYTGSYKKPREFNWAVGVFLLILTLGLSFTGYLLPWDQLAYWAITVGSTIASYVPVVGDKIRYLLVGGNVIGEGTLLRFYVLHCFILPFLMVLLISVHFWRIRKDGGLASPEESPLPENVLEGDSGQFPPSPKTYGLMALSEGGRHRKAQWGDPENEVFSWPHLLYRELLLFMIVSAGLMLISILFQAPLEEMANPTRTPNPAKAPWYFLGLQELVHYSALLGGVLIPAALVLFLVALPYLDRNPQGAGVWFHPARRQGLVLFTVCLALLTVLTLIGTFFRGPNWALVWPW